LHQIASQDASSVHSGAFTYGEMKVSEEDSVIPPRISQFNQEEIRQIGRTRAGCSPRRQTLRAAK
jgi:hypothetical protein